MVRRNGRGDPRNHPYSVSGKTGTEALHTGYFQTMALDSLDFKKKALFIFATHSGIVLHVKRTVSCVA